MKFHFNVNDRAECKRGSLLTTDVYRVNCELCLNKPEFGAAWLGAEKAKQEAFEAQTPRPMTHLFGGAIVCGCGGTLFREADRTCHGHYANYVCATCGTTTQSITETGMSF